MSNTEITIYPYSDTSAPKQQLTYCQKTVIWSLSLFAGWSVSRISERLSIPTTTVHDALRRPITPPEPKQGRKLIKDADLYHIVRLIEEDPTLRRLTYAGLRDRLQLTCSVSTIRRALREVGFRRCVAIQKPFLSPKHMAARLEFAIEVFQWPVETWMRVNFTDEAAFYIGDSENVWILRRPGEEGSPDCIVPSFKPGKAYMVHGQMCNGSTGPLTNWDRDELGNITGESFTEYILPVRKALPLISTDS